MQQRWPLGCSPTTGSASSGSRGVPPSVVLGTVLAHEIGHLLLGRNSHSATGIMRARWQSRDFYAVLKGASGFSAAESKRIREQIAHERPLSARQPESDESEQQ